MIKLLLFFTFIDILLNANCEKKLLNINRSMIYLRALLEQPTINFPIFPASVAVRYYEKKKEIKAYKNSKT